MAAGAMCLLFGWYFVKWNFATLIAYRLDPAQPQMRSIADWLATVAPNDPQTHVLLAAFLERTFDPNDLDQSLVEYDTAAGLAPDNYLMWLELGKARDRHGDYELSDVAFARALELAPNYADVQWAAGNAFIRHKQPDKGFQLIAKAATGNLVYAGPAASLVFQLYDEDASAVRQTLGDTAPVNFALSNILLSRKRYDEAVDAWRRVPPGDRRGELKEMNDQFIGQLIGAKLVGAASLVTGDLIENDEQRPTRGKVINGGFEDAIKLKNPGPFEWRIADGAQPQVGLSDAQTHSGQHALIMNFDSFESVGFRQVEQTVAVEPGKTYLFEVFYKADMKTKAEFRWEITDVVSGTVIAKTPDLVNRADWTSLTTRIAVPPKSDGIVIRLIREGCYGPICPCNGKMLFDDVSLRQE